MGLPYGNLYFAWVHEVAQKIRDAAYRNLSGGRGNLQVQTGKLRSSLFSNVWGSQDSATAQVGSNHPAALVWERDGITGPLKPNGGKAMVMPVRVGFFVSFRNFAGVVFSKADRYSKSLGRAYSAIFRARTYTRTPRKEPVYFLTRAIQGELTGYKGSVNLNKLAKRVGDQFAKDLAEQIARDNPNVTVRIE